MKKIILGTAIGACAAMLAMPASAQWYIGAGVGSAKSDGVDGTDTSLGVPVTISGDDSKTSWKVLGGYQFTPIWGVEAQYTDLGSRNITGTAVGFAPASGNFDAHQWSLAGTGTYWFSGTPTQGWFVHGKLGVSSNHVSVDNICAGINCVGGGSDSHTDVLWGVGIGHQFNKQWSIKGGYESFGKFSSDGPNGNSIKGDNFGINVMYHF